MPPHSAAKDAQTTHTQKPVGLGLITMKVSNDSIPDLSIKDIYIDIISRLDATQRSQASIIQKLCILIEENQDLKRRQREIGV
ncbi:MAG: hypothetical protein ACJ71R_06630 [Nitrososphaeraceae archaeon]